MRRLYSTFAGGWPGTGLLLLRLVAGLTLLLHASSSVASANPIQATIAAARGGCGILFLIGLWTPIAGAFAALLELWRILTMVADPWVSLLLGTVAGALSMLGPGHWSIDAHLFGWKRVEAPPRTRKSNVA